MFLLPRKNPIIQAPMAGGISNTKLASSVCNAGGLGFLAAGYKKAEEVRSEIVELKLLTNEPFGVNVFVPSIEEISVQAVKSFHSMIEVAEPEIGEYLQDGYADDDDWDKKIAILVEEKVPVVSFTFGCPSKKIIELFRRNQQYVIVTVTNLKEARISVESGANAICVQGMEAGGHQATFSNDPTLDNETPLQNLIKELKSEIGIPIIAAGGIMSGKDIVYALNLGATAVQLGTAFLLCPESGTNATYRKALVDKEFTTTKNTRAFTGRSARGLENDFMKRYGKTAPNAYPQIHHMTKQLRKIAAEDMNPHYMSLWAGMKFREIRELPVKDLIGTLMNEVKECKEIILEQ